MSDAVDRYATPEANGPEVQPESPVAGNPELAREVESVRADFERAGVEGGQEARIVSEQEAGQSAFETVSEADTAPPAPAVEQEATRNEVEQTPDEAASPAVERYAPEPEPTPEPEPEEGCSIVVRHVGLLGLVFRSLTPPDTSVNEKPARGTSPAAQRSGHTRTVWIPDTF